MTRHIPHYVAAAAIGFATLAASALPAAAHNWRQPPLQQRCDRDGDTCALFQCDRDGDDCQRVSPWRRQDLGYYERRDYNYRDARYARDDREDERYDRRQEWRDHERREHCRDGDRD